MKEFSMSKRDNGQAVVSDKVKQAFWFASGTLCGLVMLSICRASIPAGSNRPDLSPEALSPTAVTDDTALYQSLSEIRVRKERTPTFDADISRLSRMEGRYHEKRSLGHRSSVRGAMNRISKRRYQD
jgi:hypothetical protein